jgi:hypothetical protein
MTDDANVGYVALLRRLRDEMNEQASEMTSEQRARFVRESAERFARKFPLPEYAGGSEQARRQVR